jgi:hypothetical protein
MKKGDIRYAGVAGAVGGVVGLLGIALGWYSYSSPSGGEVDVDVTITAAGSLALWASIATFAFGCAYLAFSDPKIRKAMGALLTISSVIMALSVVVAFIRFRYAVQAAIVADGLESTVVSGARTFGIFVSGIGAVLAVGGSTQTLKPGDMRSPQEPPSYPEPPIR